MGVCSRLSSEFVTYSPSVWVSLLEFGRLFGSFLEPVRAPPEVSCGSLSVGETCSPMLALLVFFPVCSKGIALAQPSFNDPFPASIVTR